MAGSNNFLQFNPSKNNQLSDESYINSAYRTGGIPAVPSAAPSSVHNKLFYQTTTMAAALAQVMANRGLTVSDTDLNSLIAVLDKIITLDSNGDMKTGSSGGNAVSATKLKTARKITLSRDVSGWQYFDGSGDIEMDVDVADDSHNHTSVTLPSTILYDAAKSFFLNGYQKLSNGLIIQWGYLPSLGSGSVAITLPIANPVTTLSVYVSSASNSYHEGTFSASVINNARFYIHKNYTGDSEGSMNGEAAYWFSIGC